MSPLRLFLRLAALLATIPGCATTRQMDSTVTPTVTRAPYGRLPDGRAVDLFTLANSHHVELRVMTYGAIITVVRTPDRAGHVDDIAHHNDTSGGRADGLSDLRRRIRADRRGGGPG